jgi:hypothetical protein
MKAYFRSLKLAAAFALLVASAALGAPRGDKQAEPSQPEAKPDVVYFDPGNAAPAAADDPLQGKIRVFSSGAPLTLYDQALLANPIERPLKPAKFWIGVSCMEVPDYVAEQLGFTPGRGLAVVEVVPNSPAAKAGVRPRDILLAADTKPLAKVYDLVQAVDKAEGKKIEFDVLRKGEHKTITVAPEHNPHWKPEEKADAKSPPLDELDKIYEWFEQQYPGQTVRPQMRLRFMHPGMILPPNTPMHPALPNGMSITVFKEGDKPTQIMVQRGKETWKVDEKGLDQLPKDVRPLVDRMVRGVVIGPDTMAPRLDYMPDFLIQRRTPTPPTDEPSAIRERIDQRMERMNQRLDELRGMIEDLRNSRGDKAATPPSGPEEKK